MKIVYSSQAFPRHEGGVGEGIKENSNTLEGKKGITRLKENVKILKT